MKKTILPILFTLLYSTCFSQTLSKTDFIEDLEFLKKTLPQKHTNLFAKLDSVTFVKKVDAIEAKAGTLNYESFSAELFKLTVAIGDEHTFIERKFTKILPIQLDLFKEGLFVTGIEATQSALLHSRLVAINNMPISKVTALFKEVVQSENQSYFDDHFLHYLNNPAFLKGLGILNSDEEAEFTLIDQQNKSVKIKLKSVEGNNLANIKLALGNSPLLSKKKTGNYWFEYVPSQKLIYFNYTKCREEENNPFSKFNDELFATIKEYQPEKIVLDLRFNSGGNSGILDQFIEQIKQSYLNQKGKFFVLIGRTTFSSAIMNAVELKRNSNATFIGEATSGNINHYGEVRGFALPKSKIVVAYSTKYWENWKGKKGPLKPDTSVAYSIKNYMAGKDEALMSIDKK